MNFQVSSIIKRQLHYNFIDFEIISCNNILTIKLDPCITLLTCRAGLIVNLTQSKNTKKQVFSELEPLENK